MVYRIHIISSEDISESPKQFSNSLGNISFANVNGDSPPRLCRGALLMWLIIRVMSSCEQSSNEFPLGHIFRIYSWFFSQ